MRVLMIGTAFLFDFFPIIVLVIAIVIIFTQIGGACAGVKGAFGGLVGIAMKSTKCGVSLLAAAGGSVAMMYVGPAIYAGLAYASKAIAFGMFFLWFWFLGWNMWAFKAKNLTINMTAFVIESLPIIELIPAITIMVWRHITLSRAADKAQAEAAAAKRAAAAAAAAQRLRVRQAYQMTPQAAYSYRQTVNVNLQQPEQSAPRYPQAAQQKGAPERYTRVGRPELRSGRSTYSRPTDKNSPPEFKLAA